MIGNAKSHSTLSHILGVKDGKVWQECKDPSLEIILWLAGLMENFKDDIIYARFACSKIRGILIIVKGVNSP